MLLNRTHKDYIKVLIELIFRVISNSPDVFQLYRPGKETDYGAAVEQDAGVS